MAFGLVAMKQHLSSTSLTLLHPFIFWLNFPKLLLYVIIKSCYVIIILSLHFFFFGIRAAYGTAKSGVEVASTS